MANEQSPVDPVDEGRSSPAVPYTEEETVNGPTGPDASDPDSAGAVADTGSALGPADETQLDAPASTPETVAYTESAGAAHVENVPSDQPATESVQPYGVDQHGRTISPPPTDNQIDEVQVTRETAANLANRYAVPVNVIRDLNADRLDENDQFTSDTARIK